MGLRSTYFKIIRTLLLALLLPCFSCMGQQENSWLVSEPLLTPGPSGAFDEVSVKDPTLVFYENQWHIFYTARSRTEYTTGYVAANKLSDLKDARRYELEMIRGKSRYGCAPQVFYFEPHGKWYLVFQNRNANYQPAFSTTPTIADPESWSEPQNLLAKDEKSKWIDFWIIGDDQDVYLFYTRSHDSVMCRSTTLQQFPTGWSEARLALTGVHEAVHVYKVKDSKQYDLVYELNQDGIRSYGLATASSLKGPWEIVTDTYATGSQLIFNAGVPEWTRMVSHGEAIRSGYNHYMEYNAENPRWLIQGILPDELGKDYVDLPWKLGLMEKR